MSAGRAKWIEALRAVAATDDLSRFDANRDRRLDTDELAIVFVGIGGKVSGAVRALATCDGPLVIDGLEFTDAAGWTLENGALDSTAVLTHELGHLFLRLDDMYTNTITTPMEYSLMDQHSNFPQMDGYSRFALGWATHSTLVRPGAVTLRATTERADVLVLPQLESPAEFFLLEYRRRGATLFDAAIPETGVAVWHIIDDELRDFEPNCADDDWGYHVTYDDDGNEISRSDWNKSRKGIRLVRPRVELRTGDTPRWRAGFEVWVPSFGPILDQEPAAICPDPGEFNARGFLSWADYRPSGYSVAWLDAGGGRNVGMNIQRRW